MLDYALFRTLLEELANVYPERMLVENISCLQNMPQKERDMLLTYLAEHALIYAEKMPYRRGNKTLWYPVKIKAKGIDFLQIDGGLSALYAPIVRIAPESLVAAIDQALVKHNIPKEERGKIQKWLLNTAGTAVIQEIVKKLIGYGTEINLGIEYLRDLVKS